MLSKLWRNGVITSAIEMYCLPCECHLRSIQEADAHVSKPVHIKALDATPFAEGHEGNGIRKVPNGYYCVFCNLLFPTASKAGLHVTEPDHINTNGQQLLRRDGNAVVAYNNIAITEKAWNGFHGQTCVVCSKDFVFENIHKSEKEHIIRLIQCRVEFGDGKSIYRKVDDRYIQCLTCNEEFLQDTQQSHFNSTEHKTKLDESKITTNNIIDENENITEEKKIEPVSVDSKKDNEKPKETIKEDTDKLNAVPNIDIENSKVKKDTKNNAIDKNSGAQDPYDVDKRFREVMNADNYISDLGHPYCIICEVDVKEGKALHLASNHHLKLLKLHEQHLAKMKANINTFDNSNDNASEVNNQDLNEENVEDKKNVDLNNNKDKILESVNELTKQGVNINFESSIATCKNCKTDLEFNYDFIIKHIEDHKVKTEKFDLNQYKDESKNTKLFSEPVMMKKGEASANVDDNSEMIDYAKKHNLELKDNLYYCGVCGVNLTVSLKQIKNHVTGKGHKNRSRRPSRNEAPERGLAAVTRRVPMMEFVEQFNQVENMTFYDIIINLKYCINVFSFFMFTRHSSRLRCQVCRVNLSLHDVDIHKMKHEHREKMQTTMVVTSFPDEFIREVQPAVLHCGYCNLAVSEGDINNHLLSISHKEVKRAMMARLHQYLPIIQNQRRRAAGIEALFLHMLFRSGMFSAFDDDDD